MVMIGIRYDLRVPPFASATHAELYGACLEQCAWSDERGVDLVVLSEHHGVADGYLPAPLTLAAAIAGRTTRMRLTVAALLVPLHDPVRLAEQLAVLDLISGSRVGVVVGLGYRQEEFDMAGVDRKQRGKLLEEYVDVLRKAWTGEPFEWRGRTVRVTPKPASPPMILIGGSTAIAARRAARLRAGFFPAIGDPALAEIYTRNAPGSDSTAASSPCRAVRASCTSAPTQSATGSASRRTPSTTPRPTRRGRPPISARRCTCRRGRRTT